MGNFNITKKLNEGKRVKHRFLNKLLGYEQQKQKLESVSETSEHEDENEGDESKASMKKSNASLN